MEPEPASTCVAGGTGVSAVVDTGSVSAVVDFGPVSAIVSFGPVSSDFDLSAAWRWGRCGSGLQVTGFAESSCGVNEAAVGKRDSRTGGVCGSGRDLRPKSPKRLRFGFAPAGLSLTVLLPTSERCW